MTALRSSRGRRLYQLTIRTNVTSKAVSAIGVRTGACVVADTLQALGVTAVFCYPGGANLELLDALSRVDIDLVRTEHEQGAIFAAQGYARASGRLGVCLATSGPGATNLVTGIADANSDSIPVLAITGNVATRWLGKNAFQEVDIVAIVRSITKVATQVTCVADLGPSIVRASNMAMQGRPGPVLIDIPKDVQQAKCDAITPPRSSSTESVDSPAIPDAVLRDIDTVLRRSRRPVIYAGGGVIAAGMASELTGLAETLRCPVVLTLMGLGGMDASHPLVLGPVGMHGAWCANVALNEADLVIALGVRFDDRVIGDPHSFARQATIVHIDIDERELGKNRSPTIGVAADLRRALPQLGAIARRLDTADWLRYLGYEHRKHPLTVEARADDESISGNEAVAAVGELLSVNTIVTTGVGQHQMWAMQQLKCSRARSFLSSSGFGTMGFGLPAAIGAKVAAPFATVVDIDGDGSLNMTVNELGTCRRHRLGVKVVIINNQWLGMVRQWQDLIYQGNRVTSSLQDSGDQPTPYPDFVEIARGYRIRAERVRVRSQLVPALTRMLSDPDEPFVLDVIVSPETNVFPMIPAGRSYQDVLFGDGQDLDGHDT